MAHGGEGVAYVNGRALFVRGGLPGDRVTVTGQEERQGVLRGVVDTVVEPSEHRREAPCPVFGQCGGCDWLHFAYPGQGEWKRRIVEESLRRLGGVEVEGVFVEEPSLRTGYRTRAAFRAGPDGWGYYAPRSHDVVAFESCPLCHPRLNEALAGLRGLYLDEAVEITVNPEGEDVLVWTTGDPILLHHRYSSVNTPNDGGAREQFLFDGAPIVNGCFSQSSLLLNRLLVGEVHRAVGGAERILDLYCGNGNLTLTLPGDRAVEGIDQAKRAVQAANRAGRGRYTAGNEKSMAQRLKQGPWDAIVLDPPRKGAKGLVPALANAKTERIVYVACDPAALGRDAGELIAAGWGIESLQVLDLFPHTHHMESVCTFVRE